MELTQAVADEMGVDPNARQELEFAALLHDVGKIAIPKEILNKPAKLDDAEWALMKTTPWRASTCSTASAACWAASARSCAPATSAGTGAG